MKHTIFITILFLLLFKVSFCQKWEYTSGGNVFDGKYKTASIRGSGGKSPYTTPLLVVNYFAGKSNINIYLNDAGYAGCDDKRAYVKFDNDDKLYSFKITTNSNNDVWFLGFDDRNKENPMGKIKFIEKMKIHSSLYVRLYSNCNQYDYEFTLSGSSTALNFVLGDFLLAKKQAKKIESEREVVKNAIIKSGNSFKTKVKYGGMIFFDKNPTSFYNGLELIEGEEIIVSGYSTNNDYCKLLKSSALENSTDTIFYIEKYTLDMKFFESIDTLIDNKVLIEK